MTFLYWILDPPIWYQNMILSLIGEQKLGLEADFASENHLAGWITFFTIVWILLEVVCLSLFLYLISLSL